MWRLRQAAEDAQAAHPAVGEDVELDVGDSDQIRNRTGIMTMASGGITLADHVNSLLAAGRADLCVMSPLHLID